MRSCLIVADLCASLMDDELARLTAHEVDLCEVCGELKPATTVTERRRAGRMVPTCATCFARDVRYAAY